MVADAGRRRSGGSPQHGDRRGHSGKAEGEAECHRHQRRRTGELETRQGPGGNGEAQAEDLKPASASKEKARDQRELELSECRLAIAQLRDDGSAASKKLIANLKAETRRLAVKNAFWTVVIAVRNFLGGSSASRCFPAVAACRADRRQILGRHGVVRNCLPYWVAHPDAVRRRGTGNAEPCSNAEEGPVDDEEAAVFVFLALAFDIANHPRNDP